MAQRQPQQSMRQRLRPLLPIPDLLEQAMSEAELQRNIETLMDVLGWTHRHIRDSRRQDVRGLPDIVAIHPEQKRLIWVELKRERGQRRRVEPTAEQAWWLAAIRNCGGESYLWRPSDWLNGTVERVLKREG